MSSSPGNREVAHRLFAAEFEDADFSYSESDEERAPNYVVTPTGARVNRLLAVGVLTEVAPAGESILRARVVDPTGAFVVYAGQYQPEAMAFLESAETPSFVAVTGKARTFQPDDSDVVYTSVRPESISEVDAATRDRWTVTTAERTLERLGTMSAALDTELSGDALREALAGSGVDASLAAGIPIARREYGTGEAYLDALQSLSLDALRQVAGEVDEVGDLSVAPNEAGGAFSPAVTVEVDASVAAAPSAGADAGAAEEATTAEASVETTDTGTGTTDATGGESGASSGGTSEAVSTEGSTPDAEPDSTAADVTAEAGAEVETDPAGGAADAEPDFEGVDAAGDDDSTEADATPETETTPEASDEGEEDLDAEEYEMDEETRQEVEEEYGVEFETAGEVESAGEAGIETPEPAGEAGDVEPTDDPDPGAGSAADDEPDFEAVDRETETEPEQEAADDEPEFEPETGGAEAESEPDEEAVETDAEEESADEEPADESADEPAEDADVESVLLSTMEDLDDGDGAPRDELVPAVADATGASESEVEDAIQALLMSGQCYEPDDDRFKPI